MAILLSETVKLIAILPLVLLNIVILSIIIILTSPFRIFRTILTHFVPIFKPNLSKILNLTGTFMALAHKNPLTLQVLAELKIDGKVDLELFRKDFQEKVLDLKNSQGQLVYPEMRQIFTNFCGYLFWTNTPCFEIQEHIGFWPNSGNLSNTSEIKVDIENSEFPQNSPQWYFHFLENFDQSGNTTCILKFHHSYMDGLSAIKLISKLFSQSKPYEEIQVPRKPSNILKSIYKVINTPVKFTQLILDILGNKIDFGQSEPANNSTVSSENMAEIFQSTNMITFEKIKQISKIHNVNDSSVILAGICGGIRNYLQQNGCKIPKKVPLFIPLKKPQHPDNKLTNHIYMGIIFLKLGETDPCRRLKIIYENSKCLQNDSYLLQFIYLLTICLSNLPKPIFQSFLQIFKFFPCPLFYSGIPGPKPKWTWHGIDAEISGFMISANTIELPLMLTSISNNTGLRINGSGSKYHFNSGNSLKTLLTLIEEEFNTLNSKYF